MFPLKEYEMFLFGNGASSGYFFKILGIGWFQFVEMSNPSFPHKNLKWIDWIWGFEGSLLQDFWNEFWFCNLGVISRRDETNCVGWIMGYTEQNVCCKKQLLKKNIVEWNKYNNENRC